MTREICRRIAVSFSIAMLIIGFMLIRLTHTNAKTYQI